MSLYVPSVGSVPHANQASVARPLEFTYALIVASLAVTEVAATVKAFGGGLGVKLRIVPLDVPELLAAAILQ